MGTIAEKLQKLIDTKNAIKAAIIAKGQEIADSDTFASYADKIASIETGIDTSDATATANDMASGVTAYVNGEKVTGSLNTISGKWHYFSNPQINAGSETSADFQFYSEIDEDILLRTWSRPAMSIPRRDFGDATASDVVSGKTFTSTAGLKVAGTASLAPNQIEYKVINNTSINIEAWFGHNNFGYFLPGETTLTIDDGGTLAICSYDGTFFINQSSQTANVYARFQMAFGNNACAILNINSDQTAGTSDGMPIITIDT